MRKNQVQDKVVRVFLTKLFLMYKNLYMRFLKLKSQNLRLDIVKIQIHILSQSQLLKNEMM